MIPLKSFNLNYAFLSPKEKAPVGIKACRSLIQIFPVGCKEIAIKFNVKKENIEEKPKWDWLAKERARFDGRVENRNRKADKRFSKEVVT